VLLFALVLLVALFAARTCGSGNKNVSNEEAIELAKDEASFVPCAEQLCVQVRYVQRGIPVRGYWGVVLAPALDADGAPTRTETFLVDVTTGEVTQV
jgi:hypothetical protein